MAASKWQGGQRCRERQKGWDKRIRNVEYGTSVEAKKSGTGAAGAVNSTGKSKYPHVANRWQSQILQQVHTSWPVGN